MTWGKEGRSGEESSKSPSPRRHGSAQSQRGFWDPKRCASHPSGLLSLRQKYDCNVPQPSGRLHHPRRRCVVSSWRNLHPQLPVQPNDATLDTLMEGPHAAAAPPRSQFGPRQAGALVRPSPGPIHAPEQGNAQRDSPRPATMLLRKPDSTLRESNQGCSNLAWTPTLSLNGPSASD